MAAIRRLSKETVDVLHAGKTVVDLAQCVEELVLNAVDAHATQINVTVNVKLAQVSVKDNGNGLSFSDLELLAEPHCTSKLQTLNDLTSIQTYGFRGEALAALGAVAVLTVETRQASETTTFCKIVQGGKVVAKGRAGHELPEAGTVVTVSDLFFNMPVRRQRISSSDMDRVKHKLSALALILPKINLTLTDGETNHRITSSTGSITTRGVFARLFGNARSRHLINLHHIDAGRVVEGYISTDVYYAPDLQFVYINKRHVRRCFLHQTIISQLQTSIILAEDASVSEQENPFKRKKRNRHAVFMINIVLPLEEVDVTHEPTKSFVSFEDEQGVRELLKRAVRQFVCKHDLLADPTPSQMHMPELRAKPSPLAPRKREEKPICSAAQAAAASLSRFSFVSGSSATRPSPAPNQHAATELIDAPQYTDEQEQLESWNFTEADGDDGNDDSDRSSDHGVSENELGEFTSGNPTRKDKSEVRNSVTNMSTVTSNTSSSVDVGSSVDNQRLMLPFVNEEHGHRQEWNDKAISAAQVSNESDSEEHRLLQRERCRCCSHPDSDESNTSLGTHELSSEATLRATDKIQGLLHCDNVQTDLQTPEALHPPLPQQIDTEQPQSTSSLKRFLRMRARPPEMQSTAVVETNRMAPHEQEIDGRPRARAISLQSLRAANQDKDVASKWKSEALRRMDLAISEPYQDPVMTLDAMKIYRGLSTTQSQRFDNSSFNDFQVLGQVDNKFVACVFRQTPHDSCVLILIDQHAAHERIRLERLEEEYFPATQTPRCKEQCALAEAWDLQLSERDASIAERCREGLLMWGIGITRSDADLIRVTHLPAALVDTSGPKQRLRVNRSTVDEFIESEITYLRDNDGRRRWTIPPTVQDVLNTRACHGAIRFGDELTLEQCRNLIRELSTCKLPFQCAHGRPSIAPLLDVGPTIQSEVYGSKQMHQSLVAKLKLWASNAFGTHPPS
eukprot:m.174575 g.174575  ORF g.174575 m.174575 type:complete len:964 (+) comp16540_c0_seq1:69-2960(+)